MRGCRREVREESVKVSNCRMGRNDCLINESEAPEGECCRVSQQELGVPGIKGR